MSLSTKYIIILITAFLWTGLNQNAVAQDDKKSDRQRTFTRDSIPELDLNRDTTKQDSKRKKKLKKRIFFGKKCKKGFTKKGKKEKQVIETFWYLKTFELPDPYIKDIYVFDMKDRKILERDEILETDKSRYKILHGPYKRTVGGDPVEIGIFYVGMKHGRWEKFGKGFILTDKIRFYRGWQRDADITYFDNDRKKVKEVLPYKYKVLQGSYYLFSETGQVLVHGKYQDDQKVGKWVEYFAENGRRRKETSYPKDIYKGEQFVPFVINEWDDNGNPKIKDGKPFDPSKKTKGGAPNRRPPVAKKKEVKKEPTPAATAKPSEGKPSVTPAPAVNTPSETPAVKDTSTVPKPKLTKEEIKKIKEQRIRKRIILSK